MEVVITGGALFGSACVIFATVNFLAAWGLARRAKWGWIVAVVLSGLYATSACFPLGVLMLVGLFKRESKDACGL